METIYETDVTFGHSHHYKRGAVETEPGPDGHTHPIITNDGHACIIEYKNGHSHRGDPNDVAPLPSVPFDQYADPVYLSSTVFMGDGELCATSSAHPMPVHWKYASAAHAIARKASKPRGGEGD